MKTKKLLLTLIFVLTLVSCTTMPTQSFHVTVGSEPTVTSVPTNILLPTETLVPTINPNAPAGFTRFENSVYYQDLTTETGTPLTYFWSEEEQTWLRWVTTPDGIPMLDFSVNSYLPLKVLISASAQGEQNLVSISHVDSISDSDLPPLTAEFDPKIRQRVNQEDMAQFQRDLLGMNGGKVYLSIITSAGEAQRIQLTQTTSFVTKIVGYSDLEPLVGSGVTKWQDNIGATFLSIVDGVDQSGDIVGRIAYQGDIRTLSDEQLRFVIFSIVGNVLTREDQRMTSMTTFTSVFAHTSQQLRPDGSPDVIVLRDH